ncbi:MAG: hypothetical protein A2Y78_10195 [Acidobacteria bacterium RBG_13_68_16]|nr:MAG: hypothetical protein A2Y78_10195 [Acidobacteria bacterium RBG_13_68_16]
MNQADAIRMALSGGEPVGLLGQLLHIVRNTDQGRAGNPAGAVGVTAKTWNRWLMGARGLPGGSRPTAASQKRIKAAVRASRARPSTPSRAVITADVEWNGYLNPTPHRTVHLDGLDLEEVVDRYAAGDDAGAAEAFDEAMADRYGVPVDFEEIDQWDFEA